MFAAFQSRRKNPTHTNNTPTTSDSHPARTHAAAEHPIVRTAAAAPHAHIATPAVQIQFADLDLAPELKTVLAAEGYTTPTPIQAQSIPPILAGKDVLGCAQTGTGKTAAFAVPMLHALFNSPVARSAQGRHLPRALVLSPTRELCIQIAESFATYGRQTSIRGTTVYGGAPQARQVRAIRAGVDVIVATPGRLQDLTAQGYLDFSAIEIFVLDEADRMLDMGFIKPIREIAAALPKERQTLMFSATMAPEIMRLADSLLRNPVKVAVTPNHSTADTVTQTLHMVPRTEKQRLLHYIIGEANVQRAVVFSKTKHGADRIARRLEEAGISAVAIHGDKQQRQRERALDAFKTGRMRVLVATDVAARGLDVDGITHVFNFDLPMEPEAYVHRIGRTGRAGAKGIAISFCDGEERGLLRQIERLLKKPLQMAKPISNLPQLAHSPDPEPTQRPFHEEGNLLNQTRRSDRGSGGGGGGGGYGGGYAGRNSRQGGSRGSNSRGGAGQRRDR